MTILVDGRPLVDPRGGGVTRVARGLMAALMETMPETKFVLATTGINSPDLLPFKFEHLKIPNKLWSLLCVTGATSLDLAYTKDKPDLLFLPNLGFVGKPKIPYFLVVHDLSFLIEPAWFSLKARLWHKAVHARELIRGAKHLFAVSERTKSDIVERLNVPADRITVIQMGLNSFDPIPTTEPPISERYLLCLGASDPRKNTGCASAAFQELKKDPQFADVKLVMTGKGGRIQDSPLRRGDPRDRPPSAVCFQHPDDQTLSALYQSAAALLYPSWYEGFGLPLHEAARFGTPCIASTAGALPETAPQGTLFAPPSKPQLWTEAVAQILKDPTAYQTKTSLGDWSVAANLVCSMLRVA